MPPVLPAHRPAAILPQQSPRLPSPGPATPGALTLALYSAPKAGSLPSCRWIPEPPAGKEGVCVLAGSARAWLPPPQLPCWDKPGLGELLLPPAPGCEGRRAAQNRDFI